MARRYTMSAAERRERDREQQRTWANRRVGHDHAYLILYGIPSLRIIVPVVLAVVGAVWLWFNVDHEMIGFFSAAAGFAMLLAYGANTIATGGNLKKTMALATGQRTRPAWWHGVGAAGAVLLALAVVVLPR